jgi:predicted ester cyclase
VSAQENATLARTVYDLFNRHEFDKALEHVADGVHIELFAPGLSFQGREGFRQMMAFHKAPWPDGTVEVIRQLASDDGVTNECVYRATHTAPLATPDGGAIPPTGKRIEVPFCEVWRIEAGKVVSLYSYSDNMGPMGQLGLLPAPGQPA